MIALLVAAGVAPTLRSCNDGVTARAHMPDARRRETLFENASDKIR